MASWIEYILGLVIAVSFFYTFLHEASEHSRIQGRNLCL